MPRGSVPVCLRAANREYSALWIEEEIAGPAWCWRSSSPSACWPSRRPRRPRATRSARSTSSSRSARPGRPQQCNIVGDLYKPDDASAAHPDPSVLTTNGFGGSKADQAAMGEELASEGYVVLSYSGLGFGGSGCPIELDDPDWDGKAASQLITFLGGGMAATDGTKVDYVIRDQTAHDGRHYAFDPRVGMIGGSYGGEVQFAAAEQDPRLDTIVPIITWNDLTYSLAPNNANLPTTVPSDTVTILDPGLGQVHLAERLLRRGLGRRWPPAARQRSQGRPDRLPELQLPGVQRGDPDRRDRRRAALGHRPAAPRVGRVLHVADPHSHAARPGRGRHAVPAPRGHRDLRGPAPPGHAGKDDLAVLGPLRVHPGPR